MKLKNQKYLVVKNNMLLTMKGKMRFSRLSEKEWKIQGDSGEKRSILGSGGIHPYMQKSILEFSTLNIFF